LSASFRRGGGPVAAISGGVIVALFCLACPAEPPNPYPLDDVLRLNHLQAKGTHNSYHLEPPGNRLIDWAYSHAPLATQFAEQGVRKIELDVYRGASEGELLVLHIGLLDPETTCSTLTACLLEVRRWSVANPGHHPLFIMIEPKDDLTGAGLDAHIAGLEAAVLSAFPRSAVITPDEVQGPAASLREAVTSVGWPTLGATRGRVILWLDEHGPLSARYSADHSSLSGRLMFTMAPSIEAPTAAIFNRNDAVGGEEAIRTLVAAGFVVRTRAASVQHRAAGDRAVIDAALRSGAQVISSDFPVPIGEDPYALEIPGGTPSRCNPVSAPAGCTADAVESPQRLGTVGSD
jgi:hypothetical protein